MALVFDSECVWSRSYWLKIRNSLVVTAARCQVNQISCLTLRSLLVRKTRRDLSLYNSFKNVSAQDIMAIQVHSHSYSNESFWANNWFVSSVNNRNKKEGRWAKQFTWARWWDRATTSWLRLYVPQCCHGDDEDQLVTCRWQNSQTVPRVPLQQSERQSRHNYTQKGRLAHCAQQSGPACEHDRRYEPQYRLLGESLGGCWAPRHWARAPASCWNLLEPSKWILVP